MRTMTLLTISLLVAIAGCLQPAFVAWPDDAVGMALQEFWVTSRVDGPIYHRSDHIWQKRPMAPRARTFCFVSRPNVEHIRSWLHSGESFLLEQSRSVERRLRGQTLRVNR
jgi:hypothetical protein